MKQRGTVDFFDT